MPLLVEKLQFHFLTIQVVPDYIGTAGILLSLKPDLRGDIIVMGGDVIVEGDFLHHMADTHRSRDAAGR